MQEFDEIKKMLKFTEEITDNINKLLINESEMDSNKISELYFKRKDLLSKLKSLAEKNDNKEFVNNEKYQWAERIRDITEKDRKNLELLKKVAESKGTEIKNLMNKRALLIYKD